MIVVIPKDRNVLKEPARHVTQPTMLDVPGLTHFVSRVATIQSVLAVEVITIALLQMANALVTNALCAIHKTMPDVQATRPFAWPA